MIQSVFFWLGLPLAVLVYWLLPVRRRMAFLALVSVVFVVSLDARAAVALVVWTLVFFFVAPLARTDKPLAARVLPFLLIAIFAYLGYHKYLPGIAVALGFAEATRHVLIPLGISYSTFKLVHYAIEVGRGNITDRSFASFACYMFLFPIYTAGPIERYDHFLANRSDRWDERHLLVGATRIVGGLIKKLVFGEIIIATLLKRHGGVEAVIAGIHDMSIIDAWLFLILTYLFAYMDFSAYSDIAIGTSRLFGIRIMENFRWPVLAPNIGDFWKRWHMTLAGWCQAYVYMPTIGLTRRPYLAVYATFVAMGLWHSGTLAWVCWGLYHATGVSIFLTWLRIKRKKGWLKESPRVLVGVSVIITGLFVAASFAFTVTHGRGDAWDSLRLLGRLVGI